ncbi:Ankyrin repeat [Paenibacillus sp. OK060]|uniref:ankyrin repeat domain-containing protein n=1 Tax=Paenibacillus sp. OK060 TaxID=1881034 RepID=UPI00088048B2|nr:ankyrin repeat domain-containing protein [Paenibacillus sp. OK060]SDM42034.1 Ankyrin repeat [Paenibacillus sp. OK060]
MYKKLGCFIFLLLLLVGCSNDTGDTDKVPALFQAVYDNDLAKVKELTKSNDGSINNLYKGSTVLHAAIYNLDIEMIEALVEAGADFTLKDKYGETPFFLASDLANIKAIKYFLGKGADPNEINQEGDTPLMKFAVRGNIPIDVFLDTMDIMVESGADLTIKNNQGETLLSKIKSMVDSKEILHQIEDHMASY